MRWNKEMIEYLTQNYNNFSIDELAKMMGLTRKSIACKASRLGLTKKDNGNIRIFKDINAEESAYWLGFIYADGYIIKNIENSERGTSYELGIELNSIDVEHLEKFNRVFNNYYKISFRERSMNTLDILNKNEPSNRYNKTCLIRIYSKDIVNDLIKNDIVQNKTNSCIFPKVHDKQLFLHFLRGYIDGDGSYIIDNKNRIRITIEGNNKECFNYIKNKLLTDFNISCSFYKDRECWKLQISRKQEVLKLLDLLYRNANIYLDRKYEKVINIKQAVFNRNIKDN